VGGAGLYIFEEYICGFISTCPYECSSRQALTGSHLHKVILWNDFYLLSGYLYWQSSSFSLLNPRI
jgi:hypothetical protein